MKIILEFMEVVHLQNICRRPGMYAPLYREYKDRSKIHYYQILFDAKLIETPTGLLGFGDALYPTALGAEVLKAHLPVVHNPDTDLNKALSNHYYFHS